MGCNGRIRIIAFIFRDHIAQYRQKEQPPDDGRDNSCVKRQQQYQGNESKRDEDPGKEIEHRGSPDLDPFFPLTLLIYMDPERIRDVVRKCYH